MNPIDQWKRDILFLAVLYAIQEQKRQITFPPSGEDALLAPALSEMVNRGLLVDNHVTNTYVVSEEGESLRGKMVAMYDQLLKFEVFAHVNQALSLTADNSPDGVSVYDNVLDPRFAPSPGSEDLRLAMLDWYGTAAELLRGKHLDLHQIVFMQRLRAGHYNKPGFWGDLRTGKVFQDIAAIVDSAVKWTQMGSNDDESSAAMNAIYTAGMSEQIKRDGDRCTCGAYLGMYDYYAQRDGKHLSQCDACDKSFDPPPPVTTKEECPNCGYEIGPRHRKCHGCGARINRSLPSGTVRETTTVYEEVTYEEPYYNPWGGTYLSYGYIAPAPIYPGTWYDPFNPIASVVAFELACALL